MPQFEFDKSKSLANYEKHGIDFIEAQRLWDDLMLLEFDLQHPFENRIGAIGMLHEKVWLAVYTMRDENIRIISVRRARKDEKEAYEYGRI